VRAVGALEQRQPVVAVVRGDRLLRAGQLLNAAGGRQRIQYPPPGTLAHDAGWLAGRPVVVERGAHVAEHPDQPLAVGAVLLAQRLQPLTGLVVQRGDALAEHRHDVVSRAYAREMQQARDQDPALGIADRPLSVEELRFVLTHHRQTVRLELAAEDFLTPRPSRRWRASPTATSAWSTAPSPRSRASSRSTR
jgi:hypothetical protein